jgi:hypothetical protein
MGCSCNKKRVGNLPIPVNVSPSVWGPTLWRILHTLVELTGNKTNKFLDADEEYAWLYFILSIADAIPCNECRGHFIEYLNANRPEALVKKTFSDRRDALRAWFYNLHLGTPRVSDCPVPDISELPTMYSLANMNLTEDINDILGYLQAAVNVGVISGTYFFNFRAKLDNLKVALL